MYIIEKIIKLFLKSNRKNTVNILPNEDNYEQEDVLTCKHNFMPIDSTGNILACSKCGYLIKKNRVSKEVKHK